MGTMMASKIDKKVEELNLIENIYKNTYKHIIEDPRDNQPDLLRIKKILRLFDEMVDLIEVNGFIKSKKDFLLGINELVGGNYDGYLEDVAKRDRQNKIRAKYNETNGTTAFERVSAL